MNKFKRGLKVKQTKHRDRTSKDTHLVYDVLEALQIHVARRLLFGDYHAIARHAEHITARCGGGCGISALVSLVIAERGLVAQAAALHHQTGHDGALVARHGEHLLHLGHALHNTKRNHRKHQQSKS